MTSSPSRAPGTGRRRTVGGALAVLAIAAGFFASVALAASPTAPETAARAEQGSRWQELKPAQQTTLKPLEREWSGLDASSKQKWIALSTRFPKLTPEEQSRVQERMTQWARLTPLERGQARLHYQEAKELPAQDRQARWNAYQALSPEQKRELAARAAPNPSIGGRPSPQTTARSERLSQDAPSTKSNIVPNPNFAAPPRAIAATVVQARPGATTTSITKRPAPPSHQQAGMPKIAASPGFVNRATLLPQRGPQGAATRSAAAPDAERSPQR